MARTPRVGPVTFFQLMARFGSAKDALLALPTLTRGKLGGMIPPVSEIEREMAAIEAFGAQLVCAIEPEFPMLLSQLDPPPPILTMRGTLKSLEHRCVAIVGARQASAAGRKVARELAKGLSEATFSTVSGLARGIDGEAHAASLEGGTIAVLGGGIDHIYPPQHQKLYDAIGENGVLISESPFGHRATAKDFPRRNRIITGLSEGVVVIEAAERSGSLISARTALEQNREVMAVPGSPIDPRCAGSNRLLREGATIVRNADDVIETLDLPNGPHVRAPTPPSYSGPASSHIDIPPAQINAVREALGYTPIKIDDIARAAGISANRCAAILVELELSGLAVSYPGGLVSLAS